MNTLPAQPSVPPEAGRDLARLKRRQIDAVHDALAADIERLGGPREAAAELGISYNTLRSKACPHSERGLTLKEIAPNAAKLGATISSLYSLVGDHDQDRSLFQEAHAMLINLLTELTRDFADDQILNDPWTVIPAIDLLIDILQEVRALELSHADHRRQRHLFEIPRS